MTSETQEGVHKIVEYIMKDIMLSMIGGNNSIKLTSEEKSILENISNESDDCMLYHTGNIGHATCALIFEGGKLNI